MALYLVRHACAGAKEEWRGPDAHRPLDDAGVRQARTLVSRLADADLAHVETSPTRRCVQTVEGIARAHQLPLVRRPDLASVDLGPPAVVALLSSPSWDGSLVCTHGEVLRPVLDRLAASGVAVAGDLSEAQLLAKGAAWRIDRIAGRWRLELLPADPHGACTRHGWGSLEPTDVAGGRRSAVGR